jgi:hypothetical protein
MGKSGESPALSRNCNPSFGEARIPAPVAAPNTFAERGVEQWSEDHDPLVTIDKGVSAKARIARPHTPERSGFRLSDSVDPKCYDNKTSEVSQERLCR